MRKGILKVSLRAKVDVCIFFISALVLSLASVAFVSKDISSMKKVMVVQANSVADFIAGDSALLKNLSAMEHVEAAVFYSDSGKVLAKYTRSDVFGFSSPKVQLPRVEWQEQNLTVFHKYSLNAASGTLYLQYDLGELHSDTQKNIDLVVGLIVAMLILTAILALIARKIIGNALKIISQAVYRLTREGDLTQRFDASSKDDVGEIFSGFNDFIAKIESFTHTSESVSHEIFQASDTLISSAEGATGVKDQQHMETMMVAAAVMEMNASIEEIAKSAEETAKATRDASEETKNGREFFDKTVLAIDNLSHKFESATEAIIALAEVCDGIGRVVGVINKISETTNLLALNAAIEAARAGDAGRGFAVVADEVRGLAQSTQKSIQEIQDRVTELQDGSKLAAQAMEEGRVEIEACVAEAAKSGELLLRIDDSVNSISGMTIQVAAAAEEQHCCFQDVSKSVGSIAAFAQNLGEAINLTSDNSGHLRELAERLHCLVGNLSSEDMTHEVRRTEEQEKEVSGIF